MRDVHTGVLPRSMTEMVHWPRASNNNERELGQWQWIKNRCWTLKNSSAQDPNSQRIMHQLSWITIFGSRVRRFANNIIGKSLTRDPKILVHGNECIQFLTRYFMFWTQNSAKNNHLSLILPSSPRTVFSVLALWCQSTADLWRHAN